METSEFTTTGGFRLIFDSTTKGMLGPAITDIQVVSSNVPEPHSIMLFGGGLLGLACLRWRKRTCRQSRAWARGRCATSPFSGVIVVRN